MMISVLRKSTVRPCPSVRRPSSSTCSSTLKTSGMRLLDLVEQHDLIGPAPHRFGQRAALLVADIAGRRADQPGDRMLLHELRHVDAHHRALVVEQEGGQRLGQLGLADARRSEEHERADRPVRILQAGARAAHGFRHRLHRLALADDALADLVLHAQQLVAFALAASCRPECRSSARRSARRGPAVTVSSTMPTPCRPAPRLPQLLFQLGDLAIGKFAGALELALALGDGELVARLVELLLEVGGEAELLLLGAPGAR